MKKNSFLILFFVASAVLLAQRQAEIRLEKNAIHPRYREWVNLSAGVVSNVNAPVLLFPANALKSVNYRVRLSQDKTFSAGSIVQSDLIPWAMYSPHRALKQGVWYWQYETYHKGKLLSMSPVYSFKITKDSRLFVTPTIEQFIAKTVVPHPRLYVRSSEINLFRSVNHNDIEALAMIRRADKQLKAPLPIEAPTRPRDTTGMSENQKKVMMSFMYHSFGDKVKEPIKDLCMAYFLTGKKVYVETAIRQALHIASFPMNSVGTDDDFNSASVMMAMAVAYDAGFEFLTAAEKTQLKNAITLRGNYFFKEYANEFETHSMDNHVWQHTLRRFMFTSIAMLGDIPDANKWLSYCYEVWCCRFPILGADDGGWHDGSSYFQVNFESFIYIPYMLTRISGVDFFAIPYYRNLPNFLMYSFPNNSFSTGFGDGAEKMYKPTKAYAAFADALARQTGNGYARWYADELTGKSAEELAKSTNFAIYRLLSNMDKKQVLLPQSPQKLPQSMLFRDAGFALMHNDVADATRDVMLNFSSLPFGATGHAHAAHNGFGINVGGKQLFGGSGYYSNFNDPHTLKHYRTRGHNTILVNGMTQCIGENGYGWIARFANTDKLTYVLGDATHAYDQMRTPFWIDRMQQSGVPYTLENGFGNPNVTRFRRHFVFLRPSTVIIYDELAAEQPSEWTWLLHSYQQMTSSANTVMAQNEVAHCRVDLFSSSPLQTNVHDQFFSPAVNWKNKDADASGVAEPYKNHGHAEFLTTKKTNTCRFFAVFQIKFNDEKGAFQEIKVEKGQASVGEWSVEAQMDGNKPAILKIYNKKGDAVLYNCPAIGKIKGSTLIKSKNIVQQELIDVLPQAAKSISNE